MDNVTRTQNLKREITHTHDCIVMAGGLSDYDLKVCEILTRTLDELDNVRTLIMSDDLTKWTVWMEFADGSAYKYGTYQNRDQANEIAMRVRDERGVHTKVVEA